MSNLFAYLYLLIGLIEVYAEFSGNKTMHYIAKPLLMVVLIAYYIKNQKEAALSSFHKMMIAAFAFSWVGDVALMFVGFNENFFLLGLVGFLITHILYTINFSKVTKNNLSGVLTKKWWVLLPLVGYMIGLLYLLVPSILSNEKTQPFLVPVLVYSSAIAVMVVFAINRYQRVNDASFALVFGGALLFMFSDSIIAINKFLYAEQLAYANVFIMILYITAQYLIAKGALKQFELTQ
jgi:uncharacterized membrane protein YhhN